VMGALDRPRGRAREAALAVLEGLDSKKTVVSYRETGGEYQRKFFANQSEASAFVDQVLGRVEEVRWWSEGMESDWLVDLSGLADELQASCAECDSRFFEWLVARESGQSLWEAKRHHPFKRKRKLGPGPRKGRLTQSREWDCTKTSPYNQICTHKSGYKKTVRIDKGYKAAYNAEYRAWRAQQRSKFRKIAKARWGKRG
jgi:hypothetical protein